MAARALRCSALRCTRLVPLRTPPARLAGAAVGRRALSSSAGASSARPLEAYIGDDRVLDEARAGPASGPEDAASDPEVFGAGAGVAEPAAEAGSASFLGDWPASAPSSSTTLALPDVELGFWPPDLALRLVDAVHTSLDVPWWAAVMSAAVIARVLLLPMSVYGLQQGARMQALKVPLSHLEARRQAGESDEVIGIELRALYQLHGASPLGMLLPIFVQAPVFISFFWGLRRLAEARPDAATGGALWFTDLGASDATFLLPALSTATALSLILIAMPSGAAAASELEAQTQRRMRFLFGGLTLVSLPVAINMPASVLLFWCSNNAFSLVYTSALTHVPGLKDRLTRLAPAGASAAASAPAPDAGPFAADAGPGAPAAGVSISQAHEATVGSLLGLAEALLAGGKRDEAMAMATRAHALSEQALGASHVRTQQALQRLEQMHADAGRGEREL